MVFPRFSLDNGFPKIKLLNAHFLYNTFLMPTGVSLFHERLAWDSCYNKQGPYHFAKNNPEM